MCGCAASAEPGETPADPIVIGVPNDSPAEAVIGLRNVGKFRQGRTMWVTGGSVSTWQNDWYRAA